MSQQTAGVALTPQNVVPYDINISTTFYTTMSPPYQNISSGSYLMLINPNSDIYFQTTDRGGVATSNFSYLQMPQALIGANDGSNFLYQNKNDFNYFPLLNRTSPFISAVSGIAWNGLIFVAVGNGNTVNSTSIATSKDGITWVPRDNQQLVYFGLAVIWGNSLWLVTGYNSNSTRSQVATSPDGITWTAVTTVTTTYSALSQLRRVLWSGTQFMIAAADNSFTVYTSPNGITWTGRFNAGISFYSVFYNGTLYLGLMANIGYGIYWSYDGITWTQNTAGLQGLSYSYFTTASWSPTLQIWVLGSANADNASATFYFHYAYDARGIWTNVTTYGNSLQAWGVYDIQWNGTYFLAIPFAFNSRPVYSTTGLTWTNIPATGTVCSTGLDAYAMTSSGGPGACLCWSPALQIWVAGGRGTFAGGTTLAYITAANALLAATGWVTATGTYPTTQVYQIAYSPSLNTFVAVGFGTYCIAYSTNGALWTGIPAGNTTFTTQGFGVSWSPSLSIFVASGTGTNSILTSPDGINWTPRSTTGVDTLGWGLGYSSSLNQYVLGGTGQHSLATSSDGQNWVGRTGTTLFTNALCASWNPFLFIWVAGGTGTFRIATSPDGITWTGRGAASSITGGTVYSIVWNGSYYVAGGSAMTVNGTTGQTFASSLDGINWIAQGASGITSIVYSLLWNANAKLWVAYGTGTNSFATSPGTGFATSLGMTWTGNGSTTYFSAQGAIAYSPQLNLYVAGGGGNNTLATSANATTWTGFTQLNTILNVVYTVVWGGSIWVAGGAGTNTLASSPDGITWTGRGNTIISGNVSAVAWNGSLWVAVGSGTNVFASSTNGITWTARGSTGVTSQAYALCWYPYGSLWIAGGTSGQLATSSDAITWTGRTSPITTTVYGVASAPGISLVVAVGTGSFNVMTSTNGTTWTGRTQTAIAGFSYSVAYSPQLSLWCMVGVPGGANSIATSRDATTWTGYTGSTVFSTLGRTIIWNGSMFVAVGQGTNYLATSANGTNWNAQPSTLTQTYMWGLGARQPLMLAGGQGNNTLSYSFDNGLTWIANSATFNSTGNFVIAFNGILWIAGGTGTNPLCTSSDGITWTARTLQTLTAVYCAAWSESLGLWVIGGQGTTINNINTSPDGTTWTLRSTPIDGTSVFAVAWNGSHMVAIGNGSTYCRIATSKDCFGWTSSGVVVNGPSAYVSLAWNGNVWVTGNDATTAIWSSPDGVTWTSRLSSFVAYGIAWNGVRFMAVGGSAGAGILIYTSPDGYTWTQQTSLPSGGNGGFRVTWNPYMGLWYVSCNDTTTAQQYRIVTAPDVYPLVWSAKMSNYPNSGVAAYGFAWSPTLGLWVGTGASGQNLMRSNDGANWIQTSSAYFTSNGYMVAWNGFYFMAVGGSSIFIATSSDGINWNSQAAGGLTWTAIYSVVWASSLNRWVVVGSQSSTVGQMAYITVTASTIPTASSMTFTSANTAIFTGTNVQVWDVAWSGTYFLAVGGNQGTAMTNAYAISADGITWTAQGNSQLGSTGTGRGVVWFSGASRFVIVGTGTATIVYSATLTTTANGCTFSAATNSTSIFGTQGNRITTNGNIVVATGQTTNTLAWSVDGITWNGLGTIIIPTAAYGIAWNSSTGLWVAGGSGFAVGGGCIATSADGITWYPRVNIHTTVCTAISFQGPKEKNFTINNQQWTGRSTIQNFRILG